ncbi:aldehyde dehydrogenase domain-containing protein [Mycena metata]|uniref:Aldehyde dehydrogenase domain-containing protein n=1 Tax=Mycena metata TaxID=1033252 RepID=A0AAD7K989_9AGAR|nr:aldehyde dehydrogenase domain-containing protein [Mycena metata]
MLCSRHVTRSIASCRMLHRKNYSPFIPTVPFPDPQVKPREQFVVSNPANGEQLCVVEIASESDVKQTVAGAQSIFQAGTWSRAPAIERSKILTRLARALEGRIPELAEIETLQTGRSIREMRAQLTRLPEWIDYYAALLRTSQAFVAPTQGKLLNYVQRVPLGVVAQITPFNHPLLIAVKKIAPALAAGNSVIVKPSELAPISVLEFARMAETAGVPSGVLSVLPGFGATAQLLARNPLVRKVDVTAGTQTGRLLGSTVGHNLAAFTAELGGKAPFVVFDDADITSAVNGAAFAAFVASGQTCVSGTRLIIHESIWDVFMSLFVEKANSIRRRMGNPSNPKSTMGTVISERHLQRIQSMLDASLNSGKGEVLTGGKRLSGKSELDGFDFDGGNFFGPTVIANIETTSDLWQEEIFGPVVVAKRFSTEEEAVTLANDSKYGLGAGIWTQNLSRAHRIAAEIEAGICWVNTAHRNDPSSPWGGMKESGIGRENGIEAFESCKYSQSKSTIVNIAPASESRKTDDWFAEDAEGRRYG